MDSVGPDVDELLTREIATAPLLVLLAPLLLETNDNVGAEPLGIDAHQRLQGLGVVARRDALQVQPRDKLLDGSALPQIGRQDRRGEGDPLVGTRRLVPCSRLLDFERPGARHDGSGRQVAVPNDVLPSSLVRPVGVVREEGLHFALQGSLKHLPRSLADIAVQGATALVGNRLPQALSPRHLDRLLPSQPPGVLAI